jgi:hyperosmotically inducible protein
MARIQVRQWLAMAMLTLLIAAGCQTMTGKTAGQNVSDEALTAKVKTSLTEDKAANVTRISVDTTNGVVTLNGVVDSPEQKARAEDLARRVSGVRGVNNNLQVSGRAQTR